MRKNKDSIIAFQRLHLVRISFLVTQWLGTAVITGSTSARAIFWISILHFVTKVTPLGFGYLMLKQIIRICVANEKRTKKICEGNVHNIICILTNFVIMLYEEI